MNSHISSVSRSRWNSALACLAFLTLSSNVLADPLSDLMPAKVGASACFSGDYDEAYLKKHAGQKTQSVLLSLKYEDESGTPIVRIMLRQKGHEQPFYIGGGCGWDEHVTRWGDGKRWVPAYKKDSGIGCRAITAVTSAGQGGDFPMDLSADGRTLVLYLLDDIAAWSGTTRDAQQMGLGKEDRIFQLERRDPTACGALEQELRPQ